MGLNLQLSRILGKHLIDYTIRLAEKEIFF